MWLPWVLRLAWLSLPVTAGGLLADALDERSSAVQSTAGALAWLGWAVVVLALLAPRPLGLTVLRVVAPAAFAAGLWGAVDAGTAGAGALAAAAGLPLVLAFLPEVGEWQVNGAAYGYERRYLLRPPGALLLGPIALAEVALVAGVVTGPLLLAAEQWVAGTVALAGGVPMAALCARALHHLSMRWAVLVPAGLVLKDHVALLDPVLFRRGDIERLRPAPADTGSLDLTARAPGLALELLLRDSENLVITVPGRREGQPGKSAMLLFTPTRPGALLTDAGSRRIPVD